MELTDILRIDKEQLYYVEKGVEKAIDLRESANRWWDLYHKISLFDKLFSRKKKNIYVGEKYFCIHGRSYIKFFDIDTEYCFQMNVSIDDLKEKRQIWEDINLMLHKQGFWLYDAG